MLWRLAWTSEGDGEDPWVAATAANEKQII
jgi:hypothetical protein